MSRLRILVVMVALIAGSCTWATSPDRLSGPVLDHQGGAVVPVQGAELAPGTRLVVPEGALIVPTPVVVTLVPGSSEPVPQSTRDAIIDYLPAHPFAAPLMAARSRQVGPTWILEPDGTTFAIPVMLEIDLGEVAPDISVVAIHEGGGGTIEVIADGTMDGDILRLPLDHFSVVKLIAVVGRGIETVYSLGNNIDRVAIEDAARLVGPHADEVAGRIVALQCSPSLVTGYDPSVLPGYVPLLDNLARSGVDIGNLDYGAFAKLQRWLHRVRLEGLPSATVDEIYGKSLELTGNDVFRALVLAHEVLRADRYEKKYIDLIEPIRGDGIDEVGARYHLFGMAIYGFWTEYQKAYGDGVVVDPEIAALIEETIVSGDINSDPEEFVVDVAGAELGRELFWAVEGTTDPYGFDPCAGEEPTGDTETPTGPPEASLPWHFSGSGSMAVSFSDAEGFCEIPAEMEITLATDGSMSGTLRFAPLDIHRDTRDDGTAYVECVDGPGGTGPITGTFGDGKIAWSPGGHTYAGTYSEYEVRLVDTWVQPIDEKAAAITQVSFVLERDG